MSYGRVLKTRPQNRFFVIVLSLFLLCYLVVMTVLGGSIGKNQNIDGSSIGNPGKAGGGGIIRNQHVNWIRGFARSIGIASSVVAEL